MGVLKRLLIGLVFAGALLTQSSNALADEPWRWWSHASAYGSESVWDGGYWSQDQQRWTGYYGHRTSWGWHCALPEHFDPDSPYYTWAVLTPASMGLASRDMTLLGTWVEMQIETPTGEMRTVQMPVTDGGPYGVWWNWDIQDGVIRALGYAAVAPSRYERTTGPYFGRQDVKVRYLPGRYCPRWGYTDEPPRG